MNVRELREAAWRFSLEHLPVSTDGTETATGLCRFTEVQACVQGNHIVALISRSNVETWVRENAGRSLFPDGTVQQWGRRIRRPADWCYFVVLLCAALVAAAFLGAPRCAFVFVDRACIPSFSRSCLLFFNAIFAAFRNCATQSFSLAIDFV